MNMIPEEVFKVALKGGYSPKFGHHKDLVDSNGEWIGMENSRVVSYAEITLDPDFWRSLGKALGWSEYQYKHDRTTQHRFYDLILTGGDTAAFWSELGL